MEFITSIEGQNAGEKIRRKVMGSNHVDAWLGNATDSNMPLQEAAMEHVWAVFGLAMDWKYRNRLHANSSAGRREAKRPCSGRP